MVAFLPQSSQAELSENAHKFDEGFYDKIAAVLDSSSVSGSSDTPTVYSVVLITDDKDDLVDDYDALNVFNPEHLDNVITADVRVDQIPMLGSNPNVYKIGDGQQEIERE